MKQEKNVFHQTALKNRAMACIYWVMKIFKWKIDMSTIKLSPYHYSKNKIFRARGPISMTYTEMNRIANKMFNK